MELRKPLSWMVDVHLETSGVEAGSPPTMVEDLLAELEAIVTRERRHVRWVLRHQPASSCPAVCEGRGDMVFRLFYGGWVG